MVPSFLARERTVAPAGYSLWLIPHRLRYDQVVHFYGFATATLATWDCLRIAIPQCARPGPGLAVGVVLMGMGLGALNEVIEFAATRILPSTNVGDYENTGWDLVANFAGALAAGVILALKRHDPKPASRAERSG